MAHCTLTPKFEFQKKQLKLLVHHIKKLQEPNVRVVADDRSELVRLRDEVDKTLNRYDGRQPVYIDPRRSTQRIGVIDVQDSLDKLNAKISNNELEKSLQARNFYFTMLFEPC